MIAGKTAHLREQMARKCRQKNKDDGEMKTEGKDKPMRNVQRALAALMLSLFLLGGLAALAPTAARADGDKPTIGKPIIHKDPPHGG